jgi:hypothetical protein
MEVSKKDLENQKLISQAHKDIIRTTGKGERYAPDVHEIQKWINNPKKLKEDAEDANFMLEITKGDLEEGKRKKARTKLGKKKKGDRCTRIAKSKYDVWPSAYASGAVVKCRQGKIWKGLKEEDELLDEKTDFSKEKEQGLHGWFARQGGKGKSKGWVDCNTCRDGKCKSCGRKEGESRAKYPACRPTPSACKTKGKGDSWGKKSTNEDALFEQTKQDIQREMKLKEIKSLFQRHIGKL